MRRILPVELEIRMAEEFWGSWVDQPVTGLKVGNCFANGTGDFLEKTVNPFRSTNSVLYKSTVSGVMHSKFTMSFASVKYSTFKDR